MHSKLRLAAVVVLSALPWIASAQQCPRGMMPVSVTGHATTINLSATKNVGQICITLTTADGREIFDDCGAVVGKVRATDPATGTSILNHTVAFDMMNAFWTQGDVAQVTAVLETDADGSPCAMSVSEHMTDVKFGSGLFTHATMDVYSDSNISFCPGKNLNTSSLKGQACIATRRH